MASASRSKGSSAGPVSRRGWMGAVTLTSARWKGTRGLAARDARAGVAPVGGAALALLDGA
jgi:hypothetical protein